MVKSKDQLESLASKIYLSLGLALTAIIYLIWMNNIVVCQIHTSKNIIHFPG